MKEKIAFESSGLSDYMLLAEKKLFSSFKHSKVQAVEERHRVEQARKLETETLKKLGVRANGPKEQ